MGYNLRQGQGFEGLGSPTPKRHTRKANWSGVVYLYFHCMQMILVMSKLFIFGDDWNIKMIFVYLSIEKQIVEYDIKSKYNEECLTVDKVGIEKLLARKSCFV